MLNGKYIVAGATGLMGTTALLRLKDKPDISVIAFYHNKEPFIFADNITYKKINLTNHLECITDVITGSDYVLSFAGILMTAPVLVSNPVSPITNNLLIYSKLLEASYSVGIKKILLISSSTGYPEQDTSLYEYDMFKDNPAEVYYNMGWMFRYVEILCRMYATKLKKPMNISIIRPSTIYGEYEDFNPASSHMLPALIRKVVTHENPIEIWGNGEIKRDLVYADDLFDASLLALESNNEPFSVFNVAYGKEYSINELLEIIRNIEGYDEADIVYKASRPYTGGRRVLDISQIKQLGFSPKTDIESGIRKMITHYKSMSNIT